MADLYDTEDECAKIMRTMIRGVAQIAFFGGFDVASAYVSSHLFNPYTFVVRVIARKSGTNYHNAVAASGEIGHEFIEDNPHGIDVLAHGAEWILKVAAGENVPAQALGRKTIWRREGWIIARCIVPSEDAVAAEKM